MQIYDLAIIGGGPAGAAAGVYASRKRLKTVFITRDWLGQSSVSEKIENWIGTIAISGIELSRNLEKHVKEYGKGIIDFKDGEMCMKVESAKRKAQSASSAAPANSPRREGSPDFAEAKRRQTKGEAPSGEKEFAGAEFSANLFTITTNKAIYQAKTILITSGSHRRKLEIPGADKFEHKGLTYCATCDGPLYADQDVVVVGGGNAAFESAAQLLAYCKSVTLLNRSGEFKADPGTIETVLKHPKMKAIKFAVPKEVKGDQFVTSIIYTDAQSNRDVGLPVTGIFVEIGSLPNTDFAKELIQLDQFKRIIVDPKTQRASPLSGQFNGIWAAGDCADGLYHQNNIAAGDAVKAIEDIYLYLKAKKIIFA